MTSAVCSVLLCTFAGFCVGSVFGYLYLRSYALTLIAAAGRVRRLEAELLAKVHTVEACADQLEVEIERLKTFTEGDEEPCNPN
ncbi:MAG TPA: hypothetical protein VGO53_16555 [Steroidobacteraceae bacterium]|jgi:hypothetical protein|nr:hypothetical protein [Steroidobacteraceae bacterium]